MPTLTNAVDAALRMEGYRVRVVVPGRTVRQVMPGRFEADLSSPESVKELHTLLAASEPGGTALVGGIANFLAMSAGVENSQPQAEPLNVPQAVFLLMKEFADDLTQCARAGGGLFLNFSAMDGLFGLHDPSRACAAQSATAGLVKAFAKEAPKVCVRNIDLDSSAPAEMLFTHVVGELDQWEGDLETGLRHGERTKLQIRKRPVSELARAAKLDLDHDSLVLVTGGARGVTALVARALAHESKGRIVLVGRTPLPEREAPELAPFADAAALRQHFIASLQQNGKKVLPVEIERSVRAILRDREIRANLQAVADAGGEVHYHAVDVRNDEEFAGLIDAIYSRWGRLDAVVHGAGLIEDKLIRDKTSDSFRRVFETKVLSANTLVRCLQPESLKYLAFFTSVSGRFGNAGQSDYSAANEYLSKLARNLDSQWHARVVAMSWGPWDAGMMSDELRRLYRSRGIEPMPPAGGVEAFLEELRLIDGHDPEVVLGTSIPQIAKLAEELKV